MECAQFRSRTYVPKPMDIIHCSGATGPCESVWLVISVETHATARPWHSCTVFPLRGAYITHTTTCNITPESAWHLAKEPVGV